MLGEGLKRTIKVSSVFCSSFLWHCSRQNDLICVCFSGGSIFQAFLLRSRMQSWWVCLIWGYTNSASLLDWPRRGWYGQATLKLLAGGAVSKFPVPLSSASSSRQRPCLADPSETQSTTCLSQISQSRGQNPCAKIKLGRDGKNGISSQTVPNHCLPSENVDIYFGLWRASFKGLATAKDTELVGKFQPQYAAWWPINFALIFSFLIGIGVLFAGLVRCLVEEIGLMITFLSACDTKFLPTKEQYALLHQGPGWSERFSFKKGDFQLENAILSGEMN